MTELWTPDLADRHMAQAGYFRYAAGIAILNDPNRVHELHRQDPYQTEQRDLLLIQAQTLMWYGLRGVVKYSNPPDIRNIPSSVEQRQAEALPVMLGVVDQLVADRRQDLERLNVFLPVVKPLPLVHEPLYKAVAHGHKPRVSLVEVMDTFSIHPSFGSDANQLKFDRVPLLGRAADRDLAARDQRLVAKMIDAASAEELSPDDI